MIYNALKDCTKTFFLLTLCLIVQSIAAQHIEDKRDYEFILSQKCIEGNCKNGKGKFKVEYRKGLYIYFDVYAGNFVNKKLQGSGQIQFFNEKDENFLH